MEHITAKDRAKILRTEIRKQFPKQKISVRADNFSMGSSVNIHWDMGINYNEVQEFVDKIVKEQEAKGICFSNGKTKFVEVHRHIEEGIYEKVKLELIKEYIEECKELNGNDLCGLVHTRIANTTFY